MKKLFFAILVGVLVTSASEAWAADFSTHGYYRLRFEYTHDLDLQRPNPNIVPGDPSNNSNDRFGTVAFAQQRFRLEPNLKVNDHISFHSQIDLLDNLLFGQSDVQGLQFANPVTGTLQLPAANGPFGVVAGSDSNNINVRSLYVDIMTAGGKFRIGRQPSMWGLGIFTNDGNGQEADFGDVFDRVLYLAGLDLKNGDRLNIGFVYDFAFENTLDPSISGFDNGVGSNWNDVMQGGIILLYQSDDFEFGTNGVLRFRDGNDGQSTTTAIYSVDLPDTNDIDGDGDFTELVPTAVRRPAGIDGDTLLYTIDLYGRAKILHNYHFAVEAAYIGGKIAPGVAIDAVILDDPAQAGLPNPIANPIVLPLSGTQNNISIINAATEFGGAWNFGGEANVQAGFSSGDSSPLSQRITQLGFRPDYDIALMLFDVPMGTSPAVRVGGITEQGRKSISPNFVNNAIYTTLEYKQKFDITSGVPWAEDFKVGGKIITAWAPSRTIDLNFTEITGTAGLPHIVNASRWYGVEVDLSAEATLFDFMKWRTVAGVFIPGGVFDIKNEAIDANPASAVDAILFDNADPAFAAKTTLYFEF